MRDKVVMNVMLFSLVIFPAQEMEAQNQVGSEYVVDDVLADNYEGRFRQKIQGPIEHEGGKRSAEHPRISCLIEPKEIIEVASPVAGIIDEIVVERGDYVEKGQILAKLKMRLEEVNIDLYRARLEFNERAYQRAKEVYKKDFISNNEYDQAKIERDIARYELEREKEILKRKTIRSPISGFLIEKYLSPGEYVDAEKVVKIGKIDPLHVEVTAPLEMLGKVHKGMEAKIYPEGPVKGPYRAVVEIVDKIIDPASGTFGIRLSLANAAYEIPSGVKCRVQWGK